MCKTTKIKKPGVWDRNTFYETPGTKFCSRNRRQTSSIRFLHFLSASASDARWRRSDLTFLWALSKWSHDSAYSSYISPIIHRRQHRHGLHSAAVIEIAITIDTIDLTHSPTDRWQCHRRLSNQKLAFPKSQFHGKGTQRTPKITKKIKMIITSNDLLTWSFIYHKTTTTKECRTCRLIRKCGPLRRPSARRPTQSTEYSPNSVGKWQFIVQIII
jgi:hypothetical protein